MSSLLLSPGVSNVRDSCLTYLCSVCLLFPFICPIHGLRAVQLVYILVLCLSTFSCHMPRVWESWLMYLCSVCLLLLVLCPVYGMTNVNDIWLMCPSSVCPLFPFICLVGPSVRDSWLTYTCSNCLLFPVSCLVCALCVWQLVDKLLLYLYTVSCHMSGVCPVCGTAGWRTSPAGSTRSPPSEASTWTATTSQNSIPTLSTEQGSFLREGKKEKM